MWIHKLWVNGPIIGYVRICVGPLGQPQGAIYAQFFKLSQNAPTKFKALLRFEIIFFQKIQHKTLQLRMQHFFSVG